MTARTMIGIDEDLAERLEDHAAGLGDTDAASLVDELVRHYLDGTGPYAEVAAHLRTIGDMRESMAIAADHAGALSRSLAAASGGAT